MDNLKLHKCSLNLYQLLKSSLFCLMKKTAQVKEQKSVAKKTQFALNIYDTGYWFAFLVKQAISCSNDVCGTEEKLSERGRAMN